MLNQLKSDEDSEDSSYRKRSNSQRKYQKAPDIITQVKPNSFVQPVNPHQSAFTPSNRSNKLKPEKLLLPPKSRDLSHKKTLILDLDETLVHSSFTPFEKNDIVLDVDFEGVMYNIYVLVRPDAELFIKSVAKFFEVVIFTASISKYASPLLDILDKEKNIKYRLYRDHCTFINGIYIKDLKKCNRSLKDLIIVDNSPIAYTFDSDNGLPIKTWIDDPDDKELMKLVPILEFLSKTKDVRKFIDEFVYNNKILYEEAMEIIKMKDLIDKKYFKKNDNNNIKDNNSLSDFAHNIKILPKENLEDSSLKEEKNIKKEEANVNINVNVNINNVKNNNKNTVIDINRNDEIKLNIINKSNDTSNDIQNIFREKGFNTTKNSGITNDINFNRNLSCKENNLNSYYTNNETNVSNNKINNKQNYQKQNKKNTFRLKAQEQQQNNKIGLNNIFFSNKFDPSLPLTLLLSNIAKDILTPKASSQDKNNNKKKQKEKDNRNNIRLKEIPNEKGTTNKKIKYINLLDKYKRNSKASDSLIAHINNKKLKANYSMKNMKVNKPYNLRVSSSISCFHGYTPGNSSSNMTKEKAGTSYYRVTKSKSTENLYLNNINRYSKTPKEQYRQKIVMKNRKIINFLDEFNYAKGANTKNNNKYMPKNKNNYRNNHKLKKNNINKK